MSSKLSDLINNLSEIYSEECRSCKEETKIKSIRDFIGLKNDKLHCKCNDCKKIWLTPISALIKKFPNTCEFCNGNINKFILLLKKVFILVNTWIVGEDLMKHHFLIKKLLMVNYILKTLLMKTIFMIKKCLNNLTLKIQVDIMIYMFKVIHYCLQMYFGILEINVLEYMNLILLIFSLQLDQHGKLV